MATVFSRPSPALSLSSYEFEFEPQFERHPSNSTPDLPHFESQAPSVTPARARERFHSRQLSPNPGSSHGHSSSNEIEIIDVDELPDEADSTTTLASALPTSAGTGRIGARPHRQSSHRQRRGRASTPFVISLDSDDEDYDPLLLGGSSGSGSSRVHSPSSSQNQDIPPVPRLPHGLAQSASFPFPEPSILGPGSSTLPPMRRNPPPFPDSAPVLANPMVSDYERFLPSTMARNNVNASSFPNTNRHLASSAGPSTSSFAGRRAASARAQTGSNGAGPAAGRAGGGIITSAQAYERQRRADREYRAHLRAQSGTFRPRRRPQGQGPAANDRDNMHFVGMLRHHVFDPFDPLHFGFNGLVRFGPSLGAKKEEPDYLPEYTHPVKPSAGFVHDMDSSQSESDSSVAAVVVSTQPKPGRKLPITSLENPIVLDDDGEIVQEPGSAELHSSSVVASFSSVPGSSKSSTSNIPTIPIPIAISLVCSKCLDPLLLGEGATAMASSSTEGESEDVDNVAVIHSREAKARQYRIWGLRCGHLIDGKCLDVVGYPALVHQLEVREEDVKGKGKAEYIDDEGTGEEMIKAEEDTVGLPSFSSVSNNSNSIRARLRSAAAPALSSSSPLSIVNRLFGSSSSASSKPKPKPKPKHRRVSKIVDTYSWNCPVANCGREHTSVRVTDGQDEEAVWKQGEGGAVALFI